VINRRRLKSGPDFKPITYYVDPTGAVLFMTVQRLLALPSHPYVLLWWLFVVSRRLQYPTAGGQHSSRALRPGVRLLRPQASARRLFVRYFRVTPIGLQTMPPETSGRRNCLCLCVPTSIESIVLYRSYRISHKMRSTRGGRSDVGTPACVGADNDNGRYSTISWVVSMGKTFALGPSVVDPRSGEILDSDIIFTHVSSSCCV
jgi:hypothetical protein